MVEEGGGREYVCLGGLTEAGGLAGAFLGVVELAPPFSNTDLAAWKLFDELPVRGVFSGRVDEQVQPMPTRCHEN